MIITLFFFATFLGAVKHFEKGWILEKALAQSPEFYLWIAACLLVFRLGMVFCKYYPLVADFISSIINLSAKADDFFRSNRSGRGPSDSSSPFSQSGQKRKLSTLSSSKIPSSGHVGTDPTLGSVGPLDLIDPKPLFLKKGKPTKGAISRNKSRSNNIFYRTTLLRLNFNLDKIFDYLTVKGGAGIIPILRGIAIFTGTRLSLNVFKFLFNFAKTCHKIGSTQGPEGLVKFLKAAGVSLQQALGGHLERDAAKLGARISRTRSGLPRFIPVTYREMIRQGDPRAIRLSLTLINIFRVIEYPGTLKLETITAASTANESLTRFLTGLIPLFVKLFVKSQISLKALHRKVETFARDSVQPMFKGGPGAPGHVGLWNTHPRVLVYALMGLYRSKTLWEAFMNIVAHSSNQAVQNLIDICLSLRFIAGPYDRERGGMTRRPTILNLGLRTLGKLSTKEEAAGKVRVFAMVDAWTQWVLAPYHHAIFWLLRGIPMDGTFNQTAPLKRVKAVRGLWSLDLSAATDRLPISIQKSLLGAIFGREWAASWAHLLVGRTYALRLDENQPFMPPKGMKLGIHKLKYTVGQPMGALSSWASLAITHHFLVQCSAWRAGFPKWKLYTNYAVLGDDVVIGDHRVSTQYLEIMASLGVGVNTSKSLLSKTGTALEFAKRTIVNGTDVSPIAFKEFFAATRNIGAFVMLINKTNVTFAQALQALGVGWRVRSWLNKPIGKLSARVRLLILSVNIPTTEEAVISFFEMGKAVVPQFRVDTLMVILSFVEKEAGLIFEKIHRLAPLSLGGTGSLEWAVTLAKSIMFDLGFKGAPDTSYIWEGYQTFVSEWSEKELFTGTESADARQIAIALYHLIHTLRSATTKFWKLDLNNLATRAWGLMTLDPSQSGSTFAAVYMEWLKLSKEMSLFSQTVNATIRPEPGDAMGIMSPQQIRLWKKWSAILQGSKALESTLPDKDSNTVTGQTPHNPVEIRDEFDWEGYQFFNKAAIHEGYYNPWAPMSNLGPVRGFRQYLSYYGKP